MELHGFQAHPLGELHNLFSRGIHEDAQGGHLGMMVQNLSRSLLGDTARASRIEVQTDGIGAGLDSRVRIFRTSDAANLNAKHWKDFNLF